MSWIGVDAYGGEIVGCRFEGQSDGPNAYGISSHDTDGLSVSACSFFGVENFFEGANDTIVGNEFLASFGQAQNRVILLDGAVQMTIVGNTFDGSFTDEYIVNQGSIENIIITNNEFLAGGILLGNTNGNCDGVSVLDNRFYDDVTITFDAGAVNWRIVDTIIAGNNMGDENFGGEGRIEILGTDVQVRNLVIQDNLLGDSQSSSGAMINVNFKDNNIDNGSGIKITGNTIQNDANAGESIRVSGETTKAFGSVEISNNKIWQGEGVYVEYVRDLVVSDNIVEVSQHAATQAIDSQQFELVLCDTIVCSNNVLIGGDNGDVAGTGAVLYVEATNGGSVRDNDVWGKIDGALDTAIEISGPFYVVGNRYHGTHSEYGGTPFTNEIVVVGTGAVIGPNGSTVDGSGGTSVEYEDVDSLVWTMSQTLTVKTGLLEIPFGVAAEIIEIEARVSVQPTGSAIIVDVNKNGVTMFTGGTDRPTIATSTNVDTGVPAITAIADNDYLSVDVDQIDSNAVGQNLTVTIRFRRT